MYLSKVHIENYRSIKELDLAFDNGKNVIVGKNNAGKSNIIKAIDIVLGERVPDWNKYENISKSDFFNGDTSEDIVIICELNKEDGEILNFANVKSSAFFKVYNNEEKVFYKVDLSDIDQIFYFTTEEGLIDLDSELYRKSWIGGKNYCAHSYYDEFSNVNQYALVFKARFEDNIIKKDLVLLYKKEDEDEWIVGINANSLRGNLIQSAIIPSFRDPKDQLRINNYTWFGKLLKEYTKGRNGAGIKKALENLSIESNQVFEELQKSVCNDNIQIAFPNTSFSVQYNPDPNDHDIYKSALIYVDDGFNSELKDKGSGIQSAMTIGLFNFYIKHIAHNSGSLLAIEEPELYLHPHGRRIISDRLSEFIGEDENQVIITTHSPEFICCANENINLIVVKKDNCETKAYNLQFNDIKTKQILIKKQNSEMFFADAVLLVEGADKYILEEFSKEYGANKKIKNDSRVLGKNWLNNYNVSIINCGGKTELQKYAVVLSKLSIPYFAMADFDFFAEGSGKYLQSLEFNSLKNELNDLKSKIKKLKPTGKLKSIEDIPKELEYDVKQYLKKLHIINLYILSGELENFYFEKPHYGKEQGVLELICKTLCENSGITEYVDTGEFEELFDLFLKKCLKLN
ncbi:ATP-dependent nuclease [Methanococcus maripaludis]|uniref:Putative ATP-dependent endonuclease of OLD family n=1 Tax=Methanococcus maripaludis TaxID=39152 RepID=A0A7J9S245_METMI|nr:AAA family ATPase [Methanococcus maripaludis]MBB6068024.1 putative ATP-dependent endonuclease of OLD family [Methanococcus maripaludis]